MMEKTWRWFGKKDKITLPMLRQIGVEGIVTALHEVPNGEIWTVEAINDLKSYIESYGLRWSVVESLPVCEAIKYAGTEHEQLIENYKVSLANLGKCGVKTVCYNFMPVIDWIRTDLQYPWRTVPVRFTTTVFVSLTSTSKYWNVKELKKTTQKKNCIKLPNWTK
ncbi:mannonate dehydratase [Bacteroides xylanisolvens]|nr:mannonate dehydratase [Bacteroides xylanisolvens]